MAICGIHICRCDLGFELLIMCVYQILWEFRQCLVKILDDVLNIFGTNRKPNECLEVENELVTWN
jgi:hypothetical protein